MTRIYQATSLTTNTSITLDEKASHHLARVLRASVGDELIIFNGEGGEYAAVITQMMKKHVQVEIQQFHAREVESPLQIHLAQGIARGEKMDFIVQKAVELGVTHIIPLITERCNVRLDNEREEKRLQHWQSVVISACEQSGRNRTPHISAPQLLPNWLLQVKTDYRFVLTPHVQTKLIKENMSHPSITLLIGPEGGLSEQEIQLATTHHFTPLNLGPRVLRTETATVAAVAVLQGIYGDLG